MNAAYERLIQTLDSHEFRYSANADEHSIIAEFRGEVGHYRILAQVTDEVKLFQVFGSAPVRIPPGAKPAVAETLTRVNCGLRASASSRWNSTRGNFVSKSRRF